MQRTKKIESCYCYFGLGKYDLNADFGSYRWGPISYHVSS